MMRYVDLIENIIPPKAFYDWFSESKVVNQDGSPLRKQPVIVLLKKDEGWFANNPCLSID